MARPKALSDAKIQWAHLQWTRGCNLEDIAASLDVTRRTLYNAFKEKGLIKPRSVPDSDWLFPTT